MINYPIVKKQKVQKSAITSTEVISIDGKQKDNSNFAHRGMKLEEAINDTCKYYLAYDKAVIYKKPTPITIAKFKPNSANQISEAYLRQASTTDYNGIYRGKYVDFEAKQTNQHASFNLKHLPEHQMKHMEAVARHGAIVFLIVGFWHYNEIYILDANIVKEYYYSKTINSIPLSVFRQRGFLVPSSYSAPVDFLQAIDKAYFEKN